MPVDQDDPRLARVAFAKCLGSCGGRPIEYYVRKYDVMLGRTNKAFEPDISLGDTKVVSRHHASIEYDFECK